MFVKQKQNLINKKSQERVKLEKIPIYLSNLATTYQNTPQLI
jgi:hypothetical protein